jgi:hypothetical protein
MKKLILVFMLVFAVVASQSLFAQDKPVEKKVEKKVDGKQTKEMKECKEKMKCCKDKKCCDKCTGEKCDGKCCAKCAECKKECAEKCKQGSDAKCAMDSTAHHGKHKMKKHMEMKTDEVKPEVKK